MLKQHSQPKGHHTHSTFLSAVQSTYGTLDTAKIAILLYALLKLQRGAHYIFNVVWGNVFIMVEALLLHV